MTVPLAELSVQMPFASSVPLLNVVAPIVPPASSEKLSKPMLLSTRGSGPPFAFAAWVTARAKSKFMTA